MYAIIPQQIPQGMRAEVNEKILFAIDSGKDLIPAESIYNCYTGIGGLHNLKQSDFASYHEYAEAKKEFEMGQFFTPHDLCARMVALAWRPFLRHRRKWCLTCAAAWATSSTICPTRIMPTAST